MMGGMHETEAEAEAEAEAVESGQSEGMGGDAGPIFTPEEIDFFKKAKRIYTENATKALDLLFPTDIADENARPTFNGRRVEPLPNINFYNTPLSRRGGSGKPDWTMAEISDKKKAEARADGQRTLQLVINAMGQNGDLLYDIKGVVNALTKGVKRLDGERKSIFSDIILLENIIIKIKGIPGDKGVKNSSLMEAENAKQNAKIMLKNLEKYKTTRRFWEKEITAILEYKKPTTSTEVSESDFPKPPTTSTEVSESDFPTPPTTSTEVSESDYTTSPNIGKEELFERRGAAGSERPGPGPEPHPHSIVIEESRSPSTRNINLSGPGPEPEHLSRVAGDPAAGIVECREAYDCFKQTSDLSQECVNGKCVSVETPDSPLEVTDMSEEEQDKLAERLENLRGRPGKKGINLPNLSIPELKSLTETVELEPEIREQIEEEVVRREEIIKYLEDKKLEYQRLINGKESDVNIGELVRGFIELAENTEQKIGHEKSDQIRNLLVVFKGECLTEAEALLEKLRSQKLLETTQSHMETDKGEFAPRRTVRPRGGGKRKRKHKRTRKTHKLKRSKLKKSHKRKKTLKRKYKKTKKKSKRR